MARMWRETPGAQSFDDEGRMPLMLKDVVGLPLIFHSIEDREIPSTVESGKLYDATSCVVQKANDLGEVDTEDSAEYRLLIFQSVLLKQLRSYFAVNTEPICATIEKFVSKAGRDYYSLT